ISGRTDRALRFAVLAAHSFQATHKEKTANGAVTAELLNAISAFGWQLSGTKSLSPDGSHLSQDGTMLFHRSSDAKRIILVDANSGRETSSIENTFGAEFGTFDVDTKNNLLLAKVNDDTLALWNIKTGKFIKKYSVGKSVGPLSFSPDAQRFATGYGT